MQGDQKHYLIERIERVRNMLDDFDYQVCCFRLGVCPAGEIRSVKETASEFSITTNDVLSIERRVTVLALHPSIEV